MVTADSLRRRRQVDGRSRCPSRRRLSSSRPVRRLTGRPVIRRTPGPPRAGSDRCRWPRRRPAAGGRRRPGPTDPSPVTPSGTRSRARPRATRVCDLGRHHHLVEVPEGLGRGEHDRRGQLVDQPGVLGGERTDPGAAQVPAGGRRRPGRCPGRRPAPARRSPRSTPPRSGTPRGRCPGSTSNRWTVTGRAARSTSMPCAGQGVEAPAADLDRRHHGRDLLDGPVSATAAARTSARRHPSMSQVPVTSPEASRVEVAVPSTTSAS